MEDNDSRKKMVNWINEMLELDHEWMLEALTKENEIKPDSDMAMMTISYEKRGLRFMTPLAIMSAAFGKPIEPVFENGIIQRFE